MTTIISIIIILFWIAYMILEGDREAFLYHYAEYTNKPLNINLHSMFLFQRTIVFIVYIIALSFNIGIWLPVLLISLGMAIISPFFHDGMYFYMRNLIDNIYPKKWLDQTKDLNSPWAAKMSKFESGWARILYLVIGLILIFLGFIF